MPQGKKMAVIVPVAEIVSTQFIRLTYKYIHVQFCAFLVSFCFMFWSVAGTQYKTSGTMEQL